MLDNQAQLSYSLPSGPATPIPATASVDVRQPLLEVAGVTAVTAIDSDTVVTAGENGDLHRGHREQRPGPGL